MAKGGGKSSASSGTRKKHARRAAGEHAEEPPIPKDKRPKGKDKKNKEPRKKVYIPPTKPVSLRPDPLESLGLAHQLPPELVVVLRRLAKKDAVTKTRALEDLQSNWIDVVKDRAKDDDGAVAWELAATTLVSMLPVWIHHLPVLFVHPNRRVRALATGVHASLLQIQDVRQPLLSAILDPGTPDDVEQLLGTWAMAAHDVDRLVATTARRTWEDVFITTEAPGAGPSRVRLDATLITPLSAYAMHAVLDPLDVYARLNPPPPVVQPPPRPQGRKGHPKPPPPPPTPPSRSRPDEEEESDEDRMARLRVGAIGVLQWILDSVANPDGVVDKQAIWPQLEPMLSHSALWSTFQSAKVPARPVDIAVSLGYQQPVLRKAGWSLLYSIIRGWKDSMEGLIPVLGPAVLRSAWSEPDVAVRMTMWEPLLKFLTYFPQAWGIDAQFDSPSSRPKPESDDESDENGESEDEEKPPMLQEGASTDGSASYRALLQFLELGCAGSPVQGYPTIIIILSTLPSSVLGTEPLTTFWTSFWAAIDGRALSGLDRAASSLAFLTSALECTAFLVRRIRSGKDEPPLVEGDASGEPSKLVQEQITRVVVELLADRLRVEEQAAGKALAQSFVTFHSIGQDLFESAWGSFSHAVKAELALTETAGRRSDLVFALLQGCLELFPPDNVLLTSAARGLLLACAERIVDEADQVLSRESPVSSSQMRLPLLLKRFGEVLKDEGVFTSRVHASITHNASTLLSSSPALLFAYFSWCTDPQTLGSTWQTVLQSVANAEEQASQRLKLLLNAALEGRLPSSLGPEGDPLDKVATGIFSRGLEGHESEANLASSLLQFSQYFLSSSSASGLLQSVHASFVQYWNHYIRKPSSPAEPFTPALIIAKGLLTSRPEFVIENDIHQTFSSHLLLAGFLTRARSPSQETVLEMAKNAWYCFAANASPAVIEGVSVRTWVHLQDLLQETNTTVSTLDILAMLGTGVPGIEFPPVERLFPNKEQLDALLETIPRDPIHCTLGVLYPLLPPSFETPDLSDVEEVTDTEECNLYARLTLGLLRVCFSDRQAAKANFWTLRHFLTLSECARELLSVPTARSAMFGKAYRRALLDEVEIKARSVSRYLLSISVEESWHAQTVAGIIDPSKRARVDDVALSLCELFDQAKSHDSVRDSLAVESALMFVLNGAGKNEADHWMLLCRQLEKNYPQTSIAVASAVASFGVEPPRLERYRNELAANIFGVRPNKANTEGLLLLRRLAAVAPDPGSDVIFLPQNRAVNLMKACQQWIASDEDINEEVESEILRVALHLAPILQDLQGSHWELIFDVAENNLEEASLSSDESLVVMKRCFDLILVIEDLAESNQALRTLWNERRDAILSLVKNIVAKDTGKSDVSEPRSRCREAALMVIRTLPARLMDHETLSQLCYLLSDDSPSVQRIAYGLAREASRKRTEYLVVEAALEDGPAKVELPKELLDLIEQSSMASEASMQNTYAQCFAWMVVFDLFIDTSLKVKMTYVEQLRNLDIISVYFLPFIFEMLNLSRADGTKPFKLDIWTVDDYYFELSEPSEPSSLTIFAAHLYYRALLTIPSLIRAWWLDCKDRQLYTTVATYTAHHFSPVIVDAELSHVRLCSAELTGENMKIRVSTAISEVAATYTVDEHDIEIAIKVPGEYPLKGIDVREVRKVGIQENRWRAWVFGVQQTISSQNGRIADGLTLFKKNLSLHFEGQAECAICYSIIAVTDGSLPTKPCKTCKNRFHASCLYKWFSTSHASNCPLCRSDIL